MRSELTGPVPRTSILAGLGIVGAFAVVMIAMIVTIALSAPAGAIELPPKKYRVQPTVPYTVSYVSRAEVGRRCAGVLSFSYLKLGAVRKAPRSIRDISLNGCVASGNRVFISNDMTPSETRRTLIHELGHVNGWRHD